MREATVSRHTRETQIELRLTLDGSGLCDVATGVGFFDHMLEQIARHGMVDLFVRCAGDVHIDDHHSVEDVGIALGKALVEALGEKRGISRYGHAYVPLDEALARVVLDLSGRSWIRFEGRFPTSKIGSFDVELVREFFTAVAMNGKMALHVESLAGVNSHHIAETMFKAFGRALRMAVRADEQLADAVPSSKGVL